MKCTKCGCEVPDNSQICPMCGAKLAGDKFPTWVIVILIIIGFGLFSLPLLGVVAALTIPSLVNSTNNVKSKAIYKKTVATLSEALLMSEAINDKKYSKFDDVWNIAIKSNLMNPVDIPNGITLADGTEIRYEKLGNPCTDVPKDPSAHTACAILTIDTNGFNKGPNLRTQRYNGSAKNINDQFKVLLYSTNVTAEKDTPEYDIIQEYKDEL